MGVPVCCLAHRMYKLLGGWELGFPSGHGGQMCILIFPFLFNIPIFEFASVRV